MAINSLAAIVMATGCHNFPDSFSLTLSKGSINDIRSSRYGGSWGKKKRGHSLLAFGSSYRSIEREREDSRIDKSALIAVSRRCRSKTWSNKTGKMRPATGDTTTLYRERERDLSIGWKEGVYPFEMTGKNRIFMGAWLVYTRKESTWSREITERKEKKRFWRHIIFP